jgi:23S rRNA pseudouridine1911/1915/1917 synthase
MRKFSASEADAGARLDVFVAAKYPEFSRSSLEALFEKNLVLVNDSPAKPSYKIRGEEVVKVDETPLKVVPPAIDLPIIYEDDEVIVINKPDGVLTHSKGALNQEATVASFIKTKLKEKKLAGNRAGIVHRLDRHTSGVIITAKTEAAQKWLQKQFSTRRVKKTYLAIVEGRLDPGKALIDAPISRNPNKPQTFGVQAGGKSAQTEYETLECFEKNGRIYSLLKLLPRTGRTHQLRVHLAYLGHPIVGDSVYGKAGTELLLHAEALELTLPNKSRQTFRAPVPEKIKSFDG